MSKQDKPHGDVILEFVAEMPGHYSRETILELFKEGQERANAKKSLGLLLSHRSDKLIEKDGRLYPKQQTHPKIVFKQTSLAELDLVSDSQFVAEFPIDIPANAESRNIMVEFITRRFWPGAKRVGVANVLSVDDITWIPPGGEVFRVMLGDFPVTPEMELSLKKYCCVVVKVKGKNVVRFREAPKDEAYIYSWASSVD